MDLPFPMALVLLEEPHPARRVRPHSGHLARPRPVAAVGPPRGLGETFTHRMDLEQASEAYELFDSRADGVLKVLLTPNP